jgi:DNA-binding transcriptional ArsR family regulator
MSDGPNIARIAALIGEPARAEILSALLGGQALTATELAQLADITKQTASAHLAKLVDAKLLAMTSQGRHRYFRLADDDVANLLETLMGVAYRAGAVRLRSSPREPALRKARVCYDHLAGEMGVLAFESLQRQKFLQLVEMKLTLTVKGENFFRDLDIDVDKLNSTRRPLCRTCLDWSVRRNHLAGAVGAALLQRIYKLGWARRVHESRIVRFTPHGERSLKKLLSAS